MKVFKTKSGLPLYTKEQLYKKYEGKYIDTYPHHFEFWNDKTNKYETVYEIRKVSSTIKENFELPERI
jgi:hypothetical protein